MAYVTWYDLFQFVMVLADVITVCYLIFKDNNKK